jgi:hypothetical protein
MKRTNPLFPIQSFGFEIAAPQPWMPFWRRWRSGSRVAEVTKTARRAFRVTVKRRC